MNQKTKDFIERYIDLIEENEFDELYHIDDEISTPDLTEALLSAGIYPLEHLDYVPSSYHCCSEDVTTVVLPKHIKRISTSAFWDCPNLTSVVLPEGLKHIGSSAFAECLKLASISFPESLEEIKADAFAQTNVVHVKIPDLITDVPKYCFEECPSLEVVELGACVINLHTGCFARCTKLHTVKINEGLERIYDFAFKECKNLKKIYLPETVQSIGENAFYNMYPIIQCKENSYAHKFALSMNYEYELI